MGAAVFITDYFRVRHKGLPRPSLWFLVETAGMWKCHSLTVALLEEEKELWGEDADFSVV